MARAVAWTPASAAPGPPSTTSRLIGGGGGQATPPTTPRHESSLARRNRRSARPPATMPLGRPFDDLAVDEEELAAAAFLARCQGRTLDAYRYDRRGSSSGRPTKGSTSSAPRGPRSSATSAPWKPVAWRPPPSTDASLPSVASTASVTSTVASTSNPAQYVRRPKVHPPDARDWTERSSVPSCSPPSGSTPLTPLWPCSSAWTVSGSRPGLSTWRSPSGVRAPSLSAGTASDWTDAQPTAGCVRLPSAPGSERPTRACCGPPSSRAPWMPACRSERSDRRPPRRSPHFNGVRPSSPELRQARRLRRGGLRSWRMRGRARRPSAYRAVKHVGDGREGARVSGSNEPEWPLRTRSQVLEAALGP